MSYVENVQAQMRKGILEFSILLIISRKEVYASEILKKLHQADLIVVEGTLYPLLSRLRKNELVKYNWKESKSGPPRKYYQLTEKGLETLEILKTNWGKLEKTLSSLMTKPSKKSKPKSP